MARTLGTLAVTEGIVQIMHSDKFHNVYETVFALTPEITVDVYFAILSILPYDAHT